MRRSPQDTVIRIMTAGIVFDLDGTLIDSAHDLAASASELVQGYGGAPLDVATVVPMVGEGASVLVERALRYAGLDPAIPGALDRFRAIYGRRLLERTRPYEGIVEVLALLTRVGPLSVLTNKPGDATLVLLEALDLRGFFTEVIGGDGPYGRKPNPAGLRALLARTGGVGVFVGDSPVDAETARAAGCPFVQAAYGFGVVKFDEMAPDLSPEAAHRWPVAHHPRELVSLVETLTLDAARMPIVMR
jgi:phosphoglycolate phosphatase